MLLLFNLHPALTEKLGIPETSEPKDKSLLIINGAGGVGSYATQLARNVFGLSTVIATASRPETIEWCKGQGATHIINHRKPLKEQIDALGLTVDYALICYDTNEYLAALVDIVKPFGQIVSIVDVDSDMPFGGGMMKGQSFHWAFMFGKPMYGIDMLSQGLALDKIADYVDKGVLKRVDTKVYDELTVKNLIEVHEVVESGRAIGKIVLSVGPGSFQ
jgi:NADPH2:quinone reductase